jgi:hypothetical protein
MILTSQRGRWSYLPTLLVPSSAGRHAVHCRPRGPPVRPHVSVTDNLDTVLSRMDQIERDDLHTLRLRITDSAYTGA